MKHALIIEANRHIAMMIEEVLVEQGFASVEIATSQAQAIEMAKARCPDLITVDAKLDSGTGVDTIRKICRDQAIPVIFVTAHSGMTRFSISDALVISKPFWGAGFGPRNKCHRPSANDALRALQERAELAASRLGQLSNKSRRKRLASQHIGLRGEDSRRNAQSPPI